MTALTVRRPAPRARIAAPAAGSRAAERHHAPRGRQDRTTRPRVARAAGAAQASVAGRSCVVPTARPRVTLVEAPVPVTRLTDRGIAVILALVALVVLAGIGCVGVTAARVVADPASPAAAAVRR